MKIKGQTVTVPVWWWMLVWGVALLASRNWIYVADNALIMSIPFWQQKRGIKAHTITQMDAMNQKYFFSGYEAGKKDGKEEGNG